MRHSRVRVLGQRPGQERERAGRRSRERGDQGRSAAGPAIRRVVEGAASRSGADNAVGSPSGRRRTPCRASRLVGLTPPDAAAPILGSNFACQGNRSTATVPRTGRQASVRCPAGAAACRYLMTAATAPVSSTPENAEAQASICTSDAKSPVPGLTISAPLSTRRRTAGDRAHVRLGGGPGLTDMRMTPHELHGRTDLVLYPGSMHFPESGRCPAFSCSSPLGHIPSCADLRFVSCPSVSVLLSACRIGAPGIVATPERS